MTNCMNAHVDMSPQEMIDLIAACPPGPWPDGWGNWKNTVAAHQILAEEFISQLRPSRSTYTHDRGIVIAGGGLKYFPSVWVNIRLLRHFGCTLPIQLWYLGDGEVDPYMKRLLEPYDVECVDARGLESEYPCRILCGWELKLYATLHSPFAQVLFLDADNGVVCDPTYLFDTPSTNNMEQYSGQTTRVGHSSPACGKSLACSIWPIPMLLRTNGLSSRAST